jgi:protein ImuB
MRRVVSVWLSQFQTAALPAAPQQGSSTHSRNGIRKRPEDPGSPDEALGHSASAIMPPVIAGEASDHAALCLNRLALWCLRYTPLVAPDPPDGLWLDITGCAHLMKGGAARGSGGAIEAAADGNEWNSCGDDLQWNEAGGRGRAGEPLGTGSRWDDREGEAALCADLRLRLERQGFAARIGLADTPGAAHALARHGAVSPVILPPGAQDVALAGLPVAALRLPEPMLDALRRLGFATIGQLMAAPRAPLARRFGGRLLLRLDQALGHSFETINPILPERVIGKRLGFIEPLVTADAFRLVIERLTQAVAPVLDRAGLGARRLDLLFERLDGTIQAIRIGTSRPSRNPAHLARLLAERLETVDPGPGVEAMRLTVNLAEPLAYVQAAAWPDDTDASVVDLAPLIDRLDNRLGHAWLSCTGREGGQSERGQPGTRPGHPRLYRFAPVESDVPERAVRRIPPLAPSSRQGRLARLSPAALAAISAPGAGPAARPEPPAASPLASSEGGTRLRRPDSG